MSAYDSNERDNGNNVKSEFIDSYFDESDSSISKEKRLKSKRLSNLRTLLTAINTAVAIIFIVIMSCILLFSISAWGNIEQFYAVLIGSDEETRAAMETVASVTGNDFIEDFIALYERKVEFILALIVLPVVLIISTVVGYAFIQKMIRIKTSIS